MSLQEINWSPFASNPLDFIAGRSERRLATPDGRPVTISQSGMDFVVTVGEDRQVTGNNLNTCYLLNQLGVGVTT